VANHKAQSEVGLRRIGQLACRLDCRFSLGEHHTSVVQECPACWSYFDTAGAPGKKGRTDLMLEIADLPAQRWLSGVQFFFGRKFEAPCFGHGHKVS
jgi:hypothetical protein